MPRSTKKIPVRDEFLILTNGKRSEKNYFEALRSEFKTIYKIKVKFMNDDPEALVVHAIAEKTRQTVFGVCSTRINFRKNLFIRQ